MICLILGVLENVSEAKGVVEIIATFSGVISLITGFFSVFVVWIGVTVIFHLLAKIFGGDRRFKKLLEVEGWCSFPKLFSVLVTLIIVAFYFPEVEGSCLGQKA